jgi:16S rRNA processing protein RimM
VSQIAARDWIEVGRIVRSHGLDGALVVQLHGDDAALLLTVERVALAGEPGRIPFLVEAAREQGGVGGGRARVELKLRGIRSREGARLWKGAAVLVAPGALPALPEGEHYHRDLIGLTARLTDGSTLGTVIEIRSTAGHDLLVIQSGAREILVPAAAEIVQRIDAAAGEIWIDAPQGLVPRGEE